MPNILIVDDEADIRDLLSDILQDEGYTATLASSASKAIDAITNGNFSAVLLDIWLENSELDGIGVLKAIKNFAPNLPVIMISGHGNIETAVQTIKYGAYDFIEKPFKAEKLIILVERAVKTYELLQENILLKNQDENAINELAGVSKQIQTLTKTALNIAPSQSRIIISGEDGTGKEFLAKFIHLNSTRKHKSFVLLNAASLIDENLDYELNGKEHKIGILQKARNGTIYIDELTNLTPTIQSKFLDVLQNPKYDIRFICGSSKNLVQAVDSGKLNSSLYYRLNVVPLNIPPIRDRKEDIEILCDNLLQYYVSTMKIPAVKLSANALTALQLYNWPGNVRQLKNVIEWIVIMNKSEKSFIDLVDLPIEIQSGNLINDENNWIPYTLSQSFKVAKDMFEQHYITSQLNKYGGNISKVAEHVGLNRTALHKKIKSFKLNQS